MKPKTDPHQSQDFNKDFSSDFGHVLWEVFPNVLRYEHVLRIDLMNVINWTRVADGVEHEIGILLRIGRADVALAYTPGLYDNPDDYTHNIYKSGNIFLTTEHQIVWVRALYPDWPASLNGEITYNYPGTAVTPELGADKYHRLPNTLG